MIRRAYILAGATATGKSAAAELLAEEMRCPILSADAMLVYLGMDIGTAKPSAATRARIPYFGLDLITPAEAFSTGRWLEAARAAFAAFPSPAIPILCGGTGLYIKALLSGLDAPAADPAARAKYEALFASGGLAALQRELASRAPARYETIDRTNPRRLTRALEQLDAPGAPAAGDPPAAPSRALPGAVILTRPRAALHARIAARVNAMFAAGLAEEVAALHQAYSVWSATAAKAIGYEETSAWLRGALSRPAAEERMVIRTRQLAKRQETWFRHQLAGTWLEIPDSETVTSLAGRIKEQWEKHGPAEFEI